jgi:RsiW-degrading membrane proteinase PrsW (M82 family)
MPFQEIRSLKWIENRKLLAIAVIGLLPLFLRIAFAQSGEMKAAYWGLALYVSVLWAFFFYYIFPAPQVTLQNSAICFFVTGAISIAILLMIYTVPPLSWMAGWANSANPVARLIGFVIAVGVPEELCKAAVLFFLVRRGGLLPPQDMLFYGLMSGLGFGIYEGIRYQTGWNLAHLRWGPEYYLANVLRLTSLPFLHAIWTGMAGYFIGFAHQYPRRKLGLLLVAIGVPAVLHGFYDFFSSNVIGLAIALLSVLLLFMYLAKSVYFEQVLAGKAEPTPTTPPPMPSQTPPTV